MKRNEPTLEQDLVRGDIEGHLVEFTLEPNHETRLKKNKVPALLRTPCNLHVGQHGPDRNHW